MSKTRGKSRHNPGATCSIFLLLLVPLLWWYHRVQKVCNSQENKE